MRASAAAAADSISEQTLIREEMNTLVAEVKYDLAHAAVQNARANVYASLGLDTFPLAAIDGNDFDGLKRRAGQLARSQRGAAEASDA
ncbi:hypothetical protein U8607_20865 [Methylobacterium durans]|uniref:hypothetical protein n=1 Tax=Methylobacterium durans TaxID=2202825 RepID=UPI002AFE5EC2|nr:hypothetical protein [Methylobacterium durans]MEA1834550.1 hypothetical protein [Methylobacterium durans]